MNTYYCKLTGDFNSFDARTEAFGKGAFGGGSHSVKQGKPTTQDSELTFTITEPNADRALDRIREIAEAVKATNWNGSVMIFERPQQ
jgi:hypothetical protein